MAIERDKTYILIYVSISFRNNVSFLKKIKKVFNFDIPYLEVSNLSEELKNVLDSYIYLEKSKYDSKIFAQLYEKYKQMSFTELGEISGNEIQNLIDSCIKDIQDSIVIGEYYKICKLHPLKNLVVQAVSRDEENMIGEYEVMGENKRIKLPISKVTPFENKFLLEKEAQFTSYIDIYRERDMKNAIVIDGDNTLWRNMFGFGNLYTAKDHTFVGGAYGMYFSLLKLKELYPEYEIHLVFDGYDKVKFEANPDYKKNRVQKTDQVKQDFKNNRRWTKAMASSLGFNAYHILDSEGDDVVGSVAHFLEHDLEYNRIFIQSVDTDFYSLVSDVVNLYVPRVEFRGISNKITMREALDKFEINEIRKINWVRSLKGDKSDNIYSVNLYNLDNGIKCSRVKKQHYLDIINDLDNFNDVKIRLMQNKRFKSFVESGQMDKNYNLLTINTNIFKGKTNLDDYSNICNQERAIELLEEFSFYKELELFDRSYRIFRGGW